MRVHFVRGEDWPEAAGLRGNFEITHGPEAPKDTEVLIHGVPKAEELDRLPALRGVIVAWAGVPEGTLKLCRERNLALFNLHHNAQATAEMAVSLLFACAKNTVPYHNALAKGHWRERMGERQGSLGLAGRTAVVLGYGSIGACVGRMLSAVGMRVIGLRNRSQPDEHAEVWGMDRLDKALELAQALVVCAPLTESTRGLIGARELGLLPEDAMVVNVGRGPILDETALYQAAKSGRIRVGSDVWYRYPRSEEEALSTLPSEQPLHELENVTMSPHHGGNVTGIESLRMAELARLLDAIAAGTAKPVDLGAGY